jgi:lysozyme family protein
MTTVRPGFAASVAFILAHEGGFQDRDDDRGNWVSGVIGKGEKRGTNFGISAASYPTLDIARLTKGEAEAIYRRDYWDAVKGDDLPPALALGVFDFAINAGKGAAIKTLQSALGVSVDGVIGPKTIAAAKDADALRIATRFAEARMLHYTSLTNWSTWKVTWTRRTLEALVAGARLA